MSDGVQPGVRIDPSLWEEFRQDIQARKGAVRGHLQTELENAIRQYLSDEPDPTVAEIRDRLARLERSAGLTPADGGADTVDGAAHTHAPSPSEPSLDEKPPANAATDKKVRYLAACIREEYGSDGALPKTLPEKTIREVVKDEYGFRGDTTRRYVAELVDSLDLRSPPSYADDVYVTPERYEQIAADAREDTRDSADDTLDSIEGAEVGGDAE